MYKGKGNAMTPEFTKIRRNEMHDPFPGICITAMLIANSYLSSVYVLTL